MCLRQSILRISHVLLTSSREFNHRHPDLLRRIYYPSQDGTGQLDWSKVHIMLFETDPLHKAFLELEGLVE